MFGHFNAFPVEPDASVSNRGAVSPDGTVGEIFEQVRRESPNALIQVNHPRSGRDGYFSSFSYDPFDGRAEQGFTDDFDLLEILNGEPSRHFEQIMKDWRAFLKQGNKIVGVGNSDSHSLAGEPGLPRNMVYAPDGDALSALRAGRCFVTSGPFVEFTLGRRPPWGPCTDRRGDPVRPA